MYVCFQDPSAEFHLNLGEVVRQVTALYRADGPTPRIRTLDLQVPVYVYVYLVPSTRYCFSLPLVSPRLFVVLTIYTVPVRTPRSVSELDRIQ
jgi:hypothetical protein